MGLHYYDGDVHKSCFVWPRYMKKVSSCWAVSTVYRWAALWRPLVQSPGTRVSDFLSRKKILHQTLNEGIRRNARHLLLLNKIFSIEHKVYKIHLKAA